MSSKQNSIIKRYYEKNKSKLEKKISKRVDQQDVEDVVHNAFLKALQFFHAYDFKKDFACWLGVILENCVKDYQSTIYRNPSGLSLDDEDTVDEEEFATHDPGIEIDYEAYEKILVEINSKTSDDLKMILSLYFLYNYPPSDITFMLVDTNVKTIKTYIHRFKTEMREKYGDK